MKSGLQPVRALLVEDSEDDALLLIAALRRGGYEPDWQRVETEAALREALAAREWDVVFCDYAMPKFDAPTALRIVRETGDMLTAIVVSGQVGEEVAVETMRLGANDFILKHNLERVVPTMERELRASRVRRERHVAAQELRASEARLQQAHDVQKSLINALPAHIALVDGQGVILAVNAGWVRFAEANALGRPNFCIGENYIEVCGRALGAGSEPARLVAAGLRRVLARELPDFVCEYPCHSPQEHRWFRLAITPLEGGVDGGAVVMHIDVSDRTKAELALRSSEEHLRLVLEAANDGVWESDFATGKLVWSERMYEMLGLSPEVFPPTIEAFAALIHPEDRPHFEQAQREVRRDGGRFHAETRIQRGDGSYGHFLGRGRAVTDATGRPVRMVGSTADVTKILRAEEQIREQAALLDHARDAILVVNLQGVIHYWNKSAEHVFGWTAEESLGCRMRDLLYQNPEACDTATEEVLGKGEWTGEVIQRTKSGGEVRIEARWTLVRDEAGNPKSILSINTDITEKKKIEAQFFRAQRMESIGTLAGGIAHDLNNVFGPIVMAIDLFKLTMTNPRELNLLEIVETSAQRGADMVKQILFFARGLESRQVLINPAQLVRELKKMAIDTFPKSIQIEIRAPEDIWKISGDHTQLYQVLLNLCVNARDAMPDGGKLKISVRNIQIDEHFVAMYHGATFGSFVVLEVADSGEGMPLEMIEKIFEPFFTTKEIGKGTGLGLSTSLAIVKNHDGFITVASRPGEGTTFQVGLPAVTHPAEMQTDPVPSEFHRGSGELILVIDDEAAIRSFTGQTLEAFGYRVVTASNGAEGTVKYAQYMGEIGAVLTDMMMPVMDGATTIRELMRMDPSVKIVAASGLSAKGVEAAASEGVRHFMAKPYTAETMLRTLHEALHPPSHDTP